MGEVRVSHIGHCRFFKWNRHALYSTAEHSEPRRGLKRSQNSAPPAVINHLIFRQFTVNIMNHGLPSPI